MSDIHIEGMGILGSMLARRLHQEGISFTWHDTEEKHVAWPVSTGLAYPDGDPVNQRGLARWHEILDEGELIADEAVATPYVFAHKKPPHGGKYPVVDYGPLRWAEPYAVSLNPIEFVERTRKVFGEERRKAPTPGADLVVCHTTEERGDGYLWGWTAKVRFDLLDMLEADLMGAQPALYAKAHRFNLTYAYPIPGTGLWWAGSVLKLQRKAQEVDEYRLFDYYMEWRELAEKLLCISNIELVSLHQGWRPRGKGGVHNGFQLAEKHGDRWLMPVMPTDGVRRGWLVVDDFIDRWSLL